ncbi:MAG: YebC/PmpR family DNA-binding transcriptional regulator [Bdellovibrionales bacterium]|nr:YebC/PmpR family DNA-binding transcriptional regulator [Bdellovibrionales bacterium]
MGRGWVNNVRVAAGAKKGKLFTKIAKEIAVAVKMGGANAEGNARLRSALRDAQKNSMPKDTVDRAIKRGLGASDEAALEEITYEGYGPHGVAVIVEALTDNRNRTVQDLRAAFVRGKGNLGETNSVLWMFDRIASIVAKAPAAGGDPEEAAINAGANEVEEWHGEEATEGKLWHFIADMTELDAVQKALTAAGWEVTKGELSFRPKTPTEIDEAQEKDLQHFVELIDDSDDVKRFHLSVI